MMEKTDEWYGEHTLHFRTFLQEKSFLNDRDVEKKLNFKM